MPPHPQPDSPTSQSRVVAVACSGGRDSIALLHATLVAAPALGLQVAALHVHHGLNPAADGWQDHLQTQVAQWASEGLPVRLWVRRLEGRPGEGESVEAWARTGRHQALHAMAVEAGADLLLLAHHRRDQAETFLLQALRGAGTAGLAAMPALQWRDGVCWARPWLDHPRQAVQAYVEQHGLLHIEDDSNADVRFARNRLRHQVWPALLKAAPGAETALARSAVWAQEALALQQEMAERDSADWVAQGALNTSAWQALSPARLSNLLRAWLRTHAGHSAPATLVERMLREVPHAHSGRWQLGEFEVHQYRGQLTLQRAHVSVASAATGGMPASDASRASAHPLPHVLPHLPPHLAPHPTPQLTPHPLPQVLDLSRLGLYGIPAWRGHIEVMEAPPGPDGFWHGVSASRLIKVELRPREGKTQFQAHAKGVPRSLKKCWQTAGIPAPQREGPLLWSAATLLYVPGLGLDARAIERSKEPLLALRWHPDAC